MAELVLLMKWFLPSCNSGYFNVERSADEQLFNVAGTVAASGTASTVKAYSFTDTILYRGRPFFYRLKIVDKDGTFKYSQVLLVRLNDALQTQSVKLYPAIISASQNLTAEIVSVKEQTLVIQFIDAEGRQIAQTVKALTAGKNRFTITTSAALQNGLIFVRFIGEGLHQTIPVFKHK